MNCKRNFKICYLCYTVRDSSIICLKCILNFKRKFKIRRTLPKIVFSQNNHCSIEKLMTSFIENNKEVITYQCCSYIDHFMRQYTLQYKRSNKVLNDLASHQPAKHTIRGSQHLSIALCWGLLKEYAFKCSMYYGCKLLIC